MICKYCGQKIEDDSVYCEKCGRKLTVSKEPAVDPLALKFLQKTGGGNATQQNVTVSEGTGRIAYKPMENLPSASGDMKLWQVLGNSRTQQSYYTEDISEVSEREFGLALQKKLDSNGVSGRVERTTIRWDESGVTQQRLVIRPLGIKNSPMCFFVGLDRVGKFTFIEEKTVIKPPELPATPQKEQPEIKPDSKTLFIGIGIAIAGLALIGTMLPIALIALVVGIVMIITFANANTQYNDAKEHNKKVKEDTAAWLKAWEEWENNVFMVSYLSDTNDVIGRIHTAFHETVEQVSQAFFSKKPEQVSVDKASQSDLRQALEKRRASFR